MQNLMPPIGTPDNLFHDGNPLTGEQGTIVTAAHLNNVQGATRDIQTELLAVLADAKIEVNPEDHAQLLKALKAVIGTVGAGKFLSISKNLKEISDAGPDAIAAALQNLQLKSAAKRDVGNATGQIPDMSFFESTKDRIYRFPNGIWVQFCSFLSTGVGEKLVRTPVPFPNRILHISASYMSGMGDTGSNYSICNFLVKSADSFTYRNFNVLGQEVANGHTMSFIVWGA